MNFGLALAKPGESELGLAARLWDANFAAWRLDSTQLDQRIDMEVARHYAKEFKQLEGNPKGLAAVQAFERLRFPERPWGAAPSGLPMAKQTRQCVVCAKEHYHSWYFNTPWLDDCPIHGSPLLTQCPTCHKDWPNADSIHKRTCHTCGIRRKSGEPLSLERLAAQEFDVIRELDVFFSESLTLASPDWNHLFHLFEGRNDEFSKTRLYPSVLAAHRYAKASDWCDSLAIGSSLMPCKHTRFTLSRVTDCHHYIADTHLPKMASIRKKVIQKGLDSLQCLSDHTLGQCDRHPTTYRYECLACECADHIKHAVFREVGRRSPMVVSHPRSHGSERFFDPGLVQSIHDRTSGQWFRVPDTIMWTIYELDVLSVLKRLVLHVRCAANPNLEYQSTRPGCHSNVLFRPYAPYSNAYFFVLEGRQCHLYYPCEYEDDTLADFANWLSITNTF